MTTFEGLNLAPSILRAIQTEGYTQPSPIQGQSIPSLMQGRDLLGIAQTGTGKTAAFSLPLLHRLVEANKRPRANHPRALILSPTRELAVQIDESLRKYGKHLPLRSTVVVGGMAINQQIRTLKRGVDVLVATPGRLVDLMNQGHVTLSEVGVLILDEADRMLDMGFIPDVKRISQQIPESRQVVLFSATMPKEIKGLADGLMKDPVRVSVTPEATTVDKIAQKIHFVAKENKRALLKHVLDSEHVTRTLVFTRTKHRADQVVRYLETVGVQSAAIHGNKSQNARQRALNDFKNGRINVLVATDLAARGIDVDRISHVINFELPDEPQSYVHRIGRTARAGHSGKAISFIEHAERYALQDVERVIRMALTIDADQPFHAPDVETARPVKPKQGGRSGGRSKGQSQRSAFGGGKPTSKGQPKSPEKYGEKHGEKQGEKQGEKSGHRKGGKPQHASKNRPGSRARKRNQGMQTAA